MSARLAKVLGALALILLAPSTTAAQMLRAVEAQPASPPTRTSIWTPITFTGAAGTIADAGGAAIALPFAFPFFGTSYGSLTATVDGMLLFDNDANALATGGTPGQKGCGWGHLPQCANTGPTRRIPDAAALPHNLIAFWWTDMIFPSASGNARWTVSGNQPDRIFTLEYSDWRTWSSSPSTGVSPRTVTVELFEGSGQIDIYYGTLTSGGDPNAWGATVGIEGPLAGGEVDGVAGLSCANRVQGAAGAVSPFRCRNADWPAGQRLSFAPSPLPDLRIGGVTLTDLRSATVAGGPGFQATLAVQVTNRGENPASGVELEVFLTSDRVTALRSWLVPTPFSVPDPALPSVQTVTRTVTVESPGTGKFFFGASVDPGNVVDEVNEDNNVFTPGVNAYFQVGIDLLADTIGVNPPIVDAAFGQKLHVEPRVRNVGTDPVGPFNAEIWLSSKNTAVDPLANPPAVKLQDIDFPGGLAAGTSWTGAFDVDTKLITTTLPVGQYYLVLRVDASAAHPQGVVGELNEANNLAASTAITFGFADLYCSPQDFKVTEPDDPYREVTQLFFGTDVRLAFKAGNSGKSASDFYNGVAMTTGPSIKPDYAICTDVTCSIPLSCQSVGVEALEGLSYPSNQQLVAYEIVCHIPAARSNGTDYPESSPNHEWQIGIVIDGGNKYDENGNDGPGSNNECAKAVAVRKPAMDLVAEKLEIPTKAAPGEVIPVRRRIANAGVLGGPFDYRYLLSANATISLIGDRALEIVGGDSSGSVGHASLDRAQADERVDYVRIAPETPPGPYYLGLVLDPDGGVRELDEGNNVLCSIGMIEVVPSALRVLNSALADAVVGAPYEEQLMTEGCGGLVEWDLYGGGLAAGLDLSTSGRIWGVPREAGDFEVVVRARCNGETVLARYVLRVVEPTASLSVATTLLPTAKAGEPYSADLVAVGGVRPYAWTLTRPDSMPPGLVLRENGTVRGTPTGAGSALLEVAVTDAHGARVDARVRLRVLAAHTLRIVGVQIGEHIQAAMPSGEAGREYPNITFVAENGVGRVSWGVAEGSLPEGLVFDVDQIYGVPTQSGMFAVVIEASDEGGNSDRQQYVVVIMPGAARFDPVSLPAVTQGDSYSFDLGPNAAKGAQFRMREGGLPEGLTLSSSGRIAGMVDQEARLGSYDFLVDVIEREGASTIAPLTIRVNASQKATPTPEQGCASAGGVAMLWVVAALAWPLLRRASRRGRAAVA